MADPYDSRFLDDPEFQSLLVGCLESLQRGETIDRDTLVKDFPKFSEEIGQFLNDRQLLEQVASDFDDVPPSHVAISAYAHTMDSASGPKDFSLGETVRYIGEYEILDEIARGGMGIVFKARQQKLGRIVALKMILSGRLADSGDVERFYREARAAGRLTHSNIVPVHEVGEHDGRHYFTMDYVEGSSLAEIIRDETLSPQKAAELVRSIAHAIQYAHEQGTVHRDLKPANVLLDSSGQPKVTDFGLAKMLGSGDDETRAELTASGQVLGTPSYMSPEQASGKQKLVGRASDIYSLGAILYACLTGRAPFVADSPVDTLLQVMNREPVSPRELNPSVSRDLETICLKCLTKEPQKRYGTAKELAEDLDRFLGGRPVTARPVGRISKTVRWCRRNPAVASLLTLVFVSMLAGTVVSAFYASVANRHAKEEETQRQLAEQSRDEAERERDAADRARTLAEQRGVDLRRQLYLAQMPQALNEWNNGNTAVVKQLLVNNIPSDDEVDLRGFEWYWLDQLTKSARLTIETGRRILDADVSSDGKCLAILCDNHLLIHRLSDGAKTHEFRVPYAERGGVQIDSTGRFVAVGHNRVQLWNLEEETLVWEGDPETHPVWVAITPDNRRVLSLHLSEGKIESARITIRELKTGNISRKIMLPARIYTAAISPSGDHVAATCRDNMIRIWDLRSGVKLKEWSVAGGISLGLSYSADGRWLTASNTSGRLTRHDAIEGKQVQIWNREPNSFHCVDSDGTGKLFATAGEQQIVYLLDHDTANPIREFRGHTATIKDVEFRPGNQELVTCDRDGFVRVWDTRKDQGVLSLSGDDIDITEATFSGDGKWFARSEGITWDEEQKGVVRMYQLDEGAVGPVLDGHENGIFGVDIANNRVYSAGYDGKLITWDLETFKPIQTRLFDKPLTALSVSASGERLLVGGAEGTVHVLDSRQEEPVSYFQVKPSVWNIRDVELSRDGRFAAARTSIELRVWDCLTSQFVFEASGLADGPVAFSHSGDQLAFAVDGTVRIVDTSTWEVSDAFEAHSRAIRGFAFQHGDQRFATRSADGVVKVWETRTWQNVLRIQLSYRNRNDQFSPIFSPDGNYLLAGRDGSDALLLSAAPNKTDEQSAEPNLVPSRAEKFTRRQMWPEALTEYERLIDLEPDAGNSLVEVSSVAAMLPKSDQALERIIAGARRAQEFEESDLTLASRLVLAAQLQPGTDPNPENSLRIAKRAWRELEKPTGMPLLYTLFRQGRDAEIVEFREQHHGIGRGWKENRMIHAAALYRLGQLQEASEILDVAADLYAHGMPSLGRGRFIENGNVLGTIWSQLIWREVSQIALSALTQAIEAAPDDPGLLYHRGLLHRRWHRWPEAFQDLNRARELDPESLEILEATIVSAILAGEFEVASDLAAPFLERIDTPDQREEIWSAARTVSLIPDASCFDELLLEKVQASAVANPSHPWKQIAVVSVLHRLGRLEEAMEELDRIEQAFPDFTSTEVLKAGLSFRRGIMLHELGDEDAAAQALKIGEAFGRQSAQPPGVFPMKGRHAFGDEIVLRKELASMLTNHSNEEVETQ